MSNTGGGGVGGFGGGDTSGAGDTSGGSSSGGSGPDTGGSRWSRLMPIISDPYTDQRNTLAQSLMKQAVPGFLRQLNSNPPRQGFQEGMPPGRRRRTVCRPG